MSPPPFLSAPLFWGGGGRRDKIKPGVKHLLVRRSLATSSECRESPKTFLSTKAVLETARLARVMTSGMVTATKDATMGYPQRMPKEKDKKRRQHFFFLFSPRQMFRGQTAMGFLCFCRKSLKIWSIPRESAPWEKTRCCIFTSLTSQEA